MSDSTKTIQEECYGTCWGAQQRIDELTQYLNEANQRIKRLEDAGDKMMNAYEEICHDSYDQKQIANWRKAKEAKL